MSRYFGWWKLLSDSVHLSFQVALVNKVRPSFSNISHPHRLDSTFPFLRSVLSSNAVLHRGDHTSQVLVRFHQALEALPRLERLQRQLRRFTSKASKPGAMFLHHLFCTDFHHSFLALRGVSHFFQKELVNRRVVEACSPNSRRCVSGLCETSINNF